MIKLIRKIRKILLPNRWKLIGKTRESKLDDFRLWLDGHISSFIGMMERIKEVILFIPVIYNTVRWDYSSIFHILHHWLTRMEESQRNDTWHLHSDKRADQIKLCVILLDRIRKDEYEENVFNEHDKRWGELHTWSSPCDLPGYSQWNSARPNVKSPEDMALERKEFRKAMEHAQYMRKQDLDLLFETIKKYHGGWWT